MWTFWAGGVMHMAQHDELLIIYHFITKHCILRGGTTSCKRKKTGGGEKKFQRFSMAFSEWKSSLNLSLIYAEMSQIVFFFFFTWLLFAGISWDHCQMVCSEPIKNDQIKVCQMNSLSFCPFCDWPSPLWALGFSFLQISAGLRHM